MKISKKLLKQKPLTNEHEIENIRPNKNSIYLNHTNKDEVLKNTKAEAEDGINTKILKNTLEYT